MDESRGVSAWELRRYFSRQVRRLRFLYKALIVVSCLIFLALAAHVIYYFNELTALECQVLTARSKVGATIQYRANLVPVLVRSVSSFVEHEEAVFYRTVDARERELRVPERLMDELKAVESSAQLDGKQTPGGGSFQDALKRIMAIAEQYPALVTSDVYQLFMNQVTEAETAIRTARNEYNDSVNEYSTMAFMFPGNVYAACFGFGEFPYFEQVPESEWANVDLAPPSSADGAAAPTPSSGTQPAGSEGPDVQK
jgi:LemA protein